MEPQKRRWRDLRVRSAESGSCLQISHESRVLGNTREIKEMNILERFSNSSGFKKKKTKSLVGSEFPTTGGIQAATHLEALQERWEGLCPLQLPLACASCACLPGAPAL